MFQLLSQEGEQCVYHAWQEAVILVGVDHGVHSQSLHGKVQQTTVKHFQKPARQFSMSFMNTDMHSTTLHWSS